MHKIYIVTGNKGKRASMQKALNGLPFEVEMIDPEQHGIYEPQHEDVAVIARSKAKQAWDILQKPLLVEDGGFHLLAFNNFPGAYSKPVWEGLGLDGFVKLMDGVEDRRCFFKGALCYVDEKGQQHLFEEENHGVFSETVSKPHPKQWSDAWRIFKPNGFDKNMADMTENEFESYRQSRENSETSRWKKLRQHLLNA